MTIDANVLRKIEKCLALANDSRGDPTTAATAMRQAQALMEKHGVTSMHVDAAKISHKHVRSKVSIRKTAQWEVSLFGMVGRAFGCDLLWQESTTCEPTDKGWYLYVGKPHNLEVVGYTIAVLQRQLMRARAEFVAGLPYDLKKGAKVAKANAFCIGWVFQVQETVLAFADPDGANRKAIDAWREQNGSNNTPKAPIRKTDVNEHASAWYAGKQAAEEVSLSRGVGAADGPLKIGR